MTCVSSEVSQQSVRRRAAQDRHEHTAFAFDQLHACGIQDEGLWIRSQITATVARRSKTQALCSCLE